MDARLVVIGEAPGREELAHNRPFIGKSGKLLRMALERAGLDPDEAYYTNAMRCMPPAEGVAKAAGAPRGSSAEKASGYRAGIEACRGRLAEEVLAHPRTLILTMGNSANRGLLGDFGFKITGKRGHPIDLEEIGVVFPTFHPASILRNQGEWPRWFSDLKYAGEIYRGGVESLKKPPKPTAYIMLKEPNEVTTYPIMRIPNTTGNIKPKELGENESRYWDSDLIDRQAGVQADWPNTVVVSGIPAAVRAVDKLLEWPILSADIETGYSYSPREGKVIALSIAWSPTEAVVFSEGLLDSKAFRPHLQRLLTSPGPLWIGHNFKYDASYLRWQLLGGEWPKEGLVNAHDTLLEHYCLDETRGVHSLESVARDLLGAQDYKFIVRKYSLKDKGYENVPREILYPYAALDTTHTFSIHEQLCPQVMADPGLKKLYTKLLLPASQFLERVQDYGLHVHQDFIKVLDETLGGKVKQAELDLEKEINKTILCKIHHRKEKLWDLDEYMESKWKTKKEPSGYLPRNWRHNSHLLEKLIGWVPMNTNERTLRDLDQTGKDQSATFGYKAKNYARGHPNRKITLNYPFIQALIDYRLSTHAYNMLVKGVVKTMEGDGRLHSYFNLHATETGRLSSTNPNLQNLPVPEKDDPAPARNIVGAPPGRVLVEADYKQLELKLLAHFSDDKNLLDVYLNGRDLHTELSIAIWGDREFDPVTGEQIGGYTNYQRVRAKAVNFGIAYGRGAGSIAAEHDILESEAEEMRQAWFRQFPSAAKWLAFLHAAPFSGKGRTIITLFGRRRRFGVISQENHSDLKNQSANFPMQSTGSDLTLLSAMRIQEKWDREGTDAHIVCLVHDALVAECPAEISEQVAAELAQVMEDTPRRVLNPKILFDTDVHIGTAWGTLKTEEMKDTKLATGTKAGSLFGDAVSKESQKRAARLT